MDNHMMILSLLDQKKNKEIELDKLIYGSVEIRNNNGNKYIYTHTKNDGLQITKYIGEYTDELMNLIVKNNIKAKELKKEIRKLSRELKELNYVDEELDQNVSLNIDFAKRNMANTIYKQAVLEGIATTLLDTENIIESGIVNNMTSEDVMKIINLKHAWEFILNKNVILSPTNFQLLCSINKIVEEGFYYNAGILRTTPVKIGGTSWMPNIPSESDIKDELLSIINKKSDDVSIAIDLLLYVTRKQMFIDGNKRTSVIFANHYLISKGKGMIVIPAEKVDKYKKLLIDFYETNDDKVISKFIKENCYLGM